MSANQNIFFVGVARMEDDRGVIIGNFSYNTETDLSGVKKVLEQPNLQMVQGKHYNFTVGEVSWHLIQDEFALIYILICSQYYPQRVAHVCLEDLERQFVTKVGGNAAQEAKTKAFTRTCGPIFQSICQKYDNLAEVDKLSAVTRKIDTVKVTMQENVNLALANCVKLETIEAAAEELQQQAGVFKKSAHELKNKMWWKNIKMWIIIGVIVAVILAIVIGVAVAQSNAAKSATKSGGTTNPSPTTAPTTVVLSAATALLQQLE